MNGHKLFSALALVTTLVISPSLAALPDDKNQPIQLRADSAEINDKKQISVYIGNVFIQQGSMELKADKITVYSDDDGVKEMVAIGEMVNFRQQREIGGAFTIGKAKRVEYFADIDEAIFIDNAELVQDGDIFKGDRIKFEMEKDIVTATSHQKGSQVLMTLPPRKK